MNKDLNPKLYHQDVEQEPTRDGFGKGLVEAGKQNASVVALCADLTESTRMEPFAKEFPDRFIQVGVAEQNLATVAAGLAHVGKQPFISSYAAFSPGRNYEQIRTTIALNDRNVKIVGSHGGISVGPDGATHQMLEDVAMIRGLPNMQVVVPADSLEAAKATIALAKTDKPAYLRLGREKSPIVTTENTGFHLDKAQVLQEGSEVTLVACGTLVYEALMAAKELLGHGVAAEVINCPVIKPLDEATILASIKKTGAVVTCEEHQVNGALGSAVAELTGEKHPAPMQRVGLLDRFGESGSAQELMAHFGLKADNIIKVARQVIARKKKHD